MTESAEDRLDSDSGLWQGRRSGRHRAWPSSWTPSSRAAPNASTPGRPICSTRSCWPRRGCSRMNWRRSLASSTTMDPWRPWRPASAARSAGQRSGPRPIWGLQQRTGASHANRDATQPDSEGSTPGSAAGRVSSGREHFAAQDGRPQPRAQDRLGRIVQTAAATSRSLPQPSQARQSGSVGERHAQELDQTLIVARRRAAARSSRTSCPTRAGRRLRMRSRTGRRPR